MKSKTLTEVFENRVLRKIFEPKKVIHELERIVNEKLYGLYFVSDVIKVSE